MATDAEPTTSEQTGTTDVTPVAQPNADAADATILGDADDATGVAANETAATDVAEDSAAKVDAPILTGAPETYEFTMPDGVGFDAEAFGAIEPVLREMDLSQDAAGRIVGAYAEKVLPLLQARAEQASDDAGAELRADWARQTQADAEVGGRQHDAAKAFAAKAMTRFAPQGESGQAFRTFLNESGLGNHPEMVRMMSRVGRALGEASLDPASGAPVAKSAEETFYGKRG